MLIRVVDPGAVYHDPDPNLEKTKPDPDSTLRKQLGSVSNLIQFKYGSGSLLPNSGGNR